MEGKAKRHFILGTILIAMSVVMILIGGISRPIAYGGIVIGICLLSLSQREQKENADSLADK